MTVNLNTNCFSIRGNGDSRYVDMTEEFSEMADAIRIVMRKWDEVKARNGFKSGAKREAIGEFLDVAHAMMTFATNTEIE